MSALSTPAFLVDEGGVLVFYNEAAGILLGRRFEELGTVGAEEWGALFGPFDGGGRADPLRAAAAGLRGPRGAARARGADDPLDRRRRTRGRGLGLPDPHRPRLARGDRRLLARGGQRQRGGAGMRVKLWGTRGSIPAPGPETIRYGGNTSCVGVTLEDGSLLALDAGSGIRSLGLALPDEPSPAAHPAHPPAPRPHPGARLLRARLPAPDRAGDLGAGLPGGLAARPDRPLRLRPALPGRGPRTALRRLLPPLPGGRVGDRLGARYGPPRSPTAARRSATGSRRARPRSPTSPTTSRAWAPTSTGSRRIGSPASPWRARPRC